MRVTIKLAEREVVLGERSARMLRFIALHSQEIEDIPVGKLVLSFSGRKIAPELSRSYRHLHDEEPTEKV